ncbi:MAG TPA: hypothetical protein VMV54_06360 [Acidocella sp.]|nr:hypothetical protein [Acidocella sp.]
MVISAYDPGISVTLPNLARGVQVVAEEEFKWALEADLAAMLAQLR